MWPKTVAAEMSALMWLKAVLFALSATMLQKAVSPEMFASMWMKTASSEMMLGLQQHPLTWHRQIIGELAEAVLLISVIHYAFSCAVSCSLPPD